MRLSGRSRCRFRWPCYRSLALDRPLRLPSEFQLRYREKLIRRADDMVAKLRRVKDLAAMIADECRNSLDLHNMTLALELLRNVLSMQPAGAALVTCCSFQRVRFFSTHDSSLPSRSASPRCGNGLRLADKRLLFRHRHFARSLVLGSRERKKLVGSVGHVIERIGGKNRSTAMVANEGGDSFNF